jgi:hypothetical protein
MAIMIWVAAIEFRNPSLRSRFCNENLLSLLLVEFIGVDHAFGVAQRPGIRCEEGYI